MEDRESDVACVKLSPDLEESMAVMLLRSPEMLRPWEPVLLALRGLEGRRKALLDKPELLTRGLLPYTHLHAVMLLFGLAQHAQQFALQYASACRNAALKNRASAAIPICKQ